MESACTDMDILCSIISVFVHLASYLNGVVGRSGQLQVLFSSLQPSIMKLSLFVYIATSLLSQVYSANDMGRAGWSWSSCNRAGDPIRIDSITVSPNPPKAGNREVVSVSGYSSVVLQNGAWAELALGTAGYGPFPIPGRPSVCSEINNAHCPINTGNFDVTGSLTIPSELKGSYNVKVDVYNADNTHLACANIQATF